MYRDNLLVGGGVIALAHEVHVGGDVCAGEGLQQAGGKHGGYFSGRFCGRSGKKRPDG